MLSVPKTAPSVPKNGLLLPHWACHGRPKCRDMMGSGENDAECSHSHEFPP